MDGGGRDRLMVYIVHVWLNLNTVMSEERHNGTATLRNCSYNAMVLPSETRDNALKQLYWRLKRLGLESTPSNNNNYNNNYMFIYTIYRLKNAML